MNLYGLTDTYLTLLSNQNEMDEEVFIDTLSSIEESISLKAENIGKLIKSIEGETDTVDKEIKRLQAIKKQKQNKVSSLKEYLLNEMKRLNASRIKTDHMTISIRNNPQSVNVLDETKIDRTYFVPTEPKLDKRALLEDMKAGLVVDGAELQRTESLQLK